MFSGVTVLTLFDLVIRSMRKNIKHYYLYFFALIFSVVLYFVFATLQHDSAIVDRAGQSVNFATSFQVAGVLLIIIAGVFIVYANAIFLKRRSREIGLYQLIGLNKGAVVRLLIIENTLLSAGALIIGMAIGALVSRVFLLLLMALIGVEGFIALSFSTAAVVQTTIVFLSIILLTTLQMAFTVYRHTLLNLFNADKKGELPRKPKTGISAILALLGIGLIVFGYWLSGNMINELLFFNMIGVLVSTILGTYLVFRVTIGWLFYRIRAQKQGRLGLNNSLSIASLMHRMKGNANSLTIITVLSAMTLAMIAGSYSLFYSTEKETRSVMPFDFMFQEPRDIWPDEAGAIGSGDFEEKLKEHDIEYTLNTIELLEIEGSYDESVFSTLLLADVMADTVFSVISADQVKNAGLEVDSPDEGNAVLHDLTLGIMSKDIKTPFKVSLSEEVGGNELTIEKLGDGNIINGYWGGQLIVNDAFFEQLKSMGGMSRLLSEVEVVNVPDQEDLALASTLFSDLVGEDAWWAYGMDYYDSYKMSVQSSGLLIFIAGFLGLVFLISTGSILYFKQMTEAEQEKQSYKTLRQLGFSVKEIMRGLIRKQIFVFGLPLVIGLAHSIFAIKAASFLFMTDITVPTTIAMGVYGFIYLLFAVLSVGYYRKVVSEAL